MTLTLFFVVELQKKTRWVLCDIDEKISADLDFIDILDG